MARSAKAVPKGLKPFQAGQSGNPGGRAAGSRHSVSLAVEALIDDEHAVLTRKVIELGKSGDATALRLCMERLCPVRRDRHVSFKLPKLESPADILVAVSAIAEGVASSQLTPSEAEALAKVVDSFRGAVEAVSYGDRIAALEAKAAAP
jgi:Family of unknown function (DUF5681)